MGVVDRPNAAERHERLIRGLLSPAAYPHAVDRVELIETHISSVLLAGDYAYKLKKAVDLGFLDFSSLERRHFFCLEEVRLNRRLAPRYYLGVVPVTGPLSAPSVGGKGLALEYAVQMRRFPPGALLTDCALDDAIVDVLAERIAAFHAGLAPVAAEQPFGHPEAVIAPMRENFAQIRAAVRAPDVLQAVDRLARWTELRFLRLRTRLEQRRRDGFVRECHGDLHRRNIALVDGEPVIFDCIEFNPALRWIDTMSELAFLVMDLREAEETARARRLLNHYLEISGDYGGLVLLRFYQVYRAMVRAKVIGIRLSQRHLQPHERADACAELHKYLGLARRILVRQRPQLLITCGLSGSGKTWLGALLREQLPLIHIRSDIERKRLHGLPLNARTEQGPEAGIYAAAASRRTYARLAALAREIIGAGYGVVVDATFLRSDQRLPFLDLAEELDCQLRILAVDAPAAVLRQRIANRLSAGRDASEADLSILELQLRNREALTPRERPFAIHLDTAEPLDPEALLRWLEQPR
jgi:aminoglycoside phosphotransferase family enzyme/predicted kinase